MARLSAGGPFIHPDCEITEATFGAYVEIGRGSRVAHATFGDYSYCDRYADIANARIGKFANIAALRASGRRITRCTRRLATTFSTARTTIGTMRGGIRRSLTTANRASPISAMTRGSGQGR